MAGCAPTRRSPTSRTTVDLAVVAVPAGGDRRGRGRRRPRASRRWSWSPPGSPRPGRTGAPAAAAARRRRPARTACAWSGPNALGRGQHRPDGPAQRHARARTCPAAGRVGFFSQSGALGHRAARRGAPSAASACRRSSRPATAPTSPATTCCSTGRTTRPPTWSCSTWRRSATRASSPGSRGGSPGQADRRGEERAAPAGAGAQRPPRGRSTTPACRRCSRSPA